MRVLGRHRAKADRVRIPWIGGVELQRRLHCGAEPEFPAPVIDSSVQRALLMGAVQGFLVASVLALSIAIAWWVRCRVWPVPPESPAANVPRQA